MPLAKIRRIQQELSKLFVYPRVKALLKQGQFKTITFDSVKFAVDIGIEYAVKNKTKGGVFNIMNITDINNNILTGAVIAAIQGNLISSNDEYIKAFNDISKKQKEALQETKPPPDIQNFNPLSAYSNFAQGENYTRGGAGDYSHYDPTQPKDPSKTPQIPSKLSDTIFGRDGRFLAGGFNYKDTPINIHSSEHFTLETFNPSQAQQYMLETQLHCFQYKILPRIEETLYQLSIYFCITYTEKIGNKSKIGKWFKRFFLGKEYHLTSQDEQNRKDFLTQLIIQEANYYLMRIDKNMYQSAIQSHLLRYNYGEDKGVLPKKEKYYLSQSDFGEIKEKADLNQLIMEQETKELLSYIKNPSLVEAQIAQQEAKIAQYTANPLEMGILFALRQIDEIQEKLEQEAKQDKDTLEIESKLLERIKSDIIPYIRDFGEYSVFRYLHVCVQYWQHNSKIDCYFWEFPYCEFHYLPWYFGAPQSSSIEYISRDTAIQHSWKREPFYMPDNKTYINAGNWLLDDYKAKYPHYKSLSPSLESFVALSNKADDELLEAINELKELSPLYFAYAQIEDYKVLLEYVTNEETIKSYKEIYGENLEYK